MRAKILVFVIGMGLICGLTAGEDVKAEQEAIKKVIQMAYIDGLCNTGDVAKMDEHRLESLH